MADRYDPRLSVRPGSDRKPADARRSAVAGDDPLAELAKIVSGRPGATGPARSRPPQANDPAASPSGGDVLGDLETELLNDLQASFAAVRELAAAPPPPVQQARPASQPAPVRPAVTETIKVEPVRAERAPAEVAELYAPLRQAPAPAREASPPHEPPRARADPREEPAPRPLPKAIPPTGQPAPERPIRQTRAPDTGDKPDLGAFQLRPTVAATPPSSGSAARQPHSRWEKPEPAGPAPAGASRFAPPRTAPAPPKSLVFGDDDLDLLGEGNFLAESENETAEDFPLEGFGEFPDDDDRQPPYADDSLESLIEPRRSRGLMLVASVIGVVLIGGIAVAVFRPAATETGTPPVIVADGLPTKITPDDTAAPDAESQNKLIYDRVNSAEDNADTTLVTPGNEAIAPVPSDGSTNNPIARVIIPGGPGYDAPVADEGLSLDGQPSTLPSGADDGSTQIAANDGEDSTIQPIGPRKVRTVIVKPDGTIVENVVNDADGAANVAAAPNAADAAPGGITTGTAAPPSAALPNPPVANDTAAIAGGSANGELQITPVPDVGGTDVAMANNPPAEAPPPVVVQPPPAATQATAPQAKTVVAAVDNTAPMDLTQAPPAVGPAPNASGGMLVQVSSQRSEDAARATYRDLQARYPSILGPYDANIQRADLPDRGTFYRVRVGPFSSSDAQRLCNDLKAAGGDCILAQR